MFRLTVDIESSAPLPDISSEELLELIEDNVLGKMMAAVEDDEVFQGEASLSEYQSYLCRNPSPVIPAEAGIQCL